MEKLLFKKKQKKPKTQFTVLYFQFDLIFATKYCNLSKYEMLRAQYWIHIDINEIIFKTDRKDHKTVSLK